MEVPERPRRDSRGWRPGLAGPGRPGACLAGLQPGSVPVRRRRTTGAYPDCVKGRRKGALAPRRRVPGALGGARHDA